MKFEKGNKFGKGGARPHSGPPKDEVREKFREMLEESNAHHRFKKILANESNDEIFLKAYQMCLDRAFGKPTENHDHNLEGVVNIVSFLKESREERGLK